MSTSSIGELAAEYAVDAVVADEPLPARWNVAPTQPVYVVATLRSGPRQLGTMRWGLVPSWASSPAVGSRMINARAETVAAKPAFREAFVRRRCVLPADGFWEWQASQHGKRPHAIRRVGGGAGLRTLAFAGLWDVWRDPAEPGATPLRTAAIVTTSANDALRAVHERMPVVLDAAGVRTWLNPAVREPARLAALLRPAPPQGWEAWLVTTRVNSVANDGPELLEPLPAPPAAGA